MSCLAVIDAETTGVNPYAHNRIIELAAVVMRPDGTVLREFVTLVNPERDMGKSTLHGLTSSDILQAPRFNDIAGYFLETLDGCVAVAGHNVHFDRMFLEEELRRIGHEFPEAPSYCTFRLGGGGSLGDCCSYYGVEFDGEPHHALHDARATARLLAALLADAPDEARTLSRLRPVAWPAVPKTTTPPLTREESRRRQAEPPTYVQRLLARGQPSCDVDMDDSSAVAYVALLDRVLEDRYIDAEEGEALIQVATRWSLDGNRVRQIHKEYTYNLAAAALADGVVTDTERRDLYRVANLLGLDPACLDGLLAKAAEKLSQIPCQRQTSTETPRTDEFRGKRVCFTGECQSHLDGEPITREIALELAASKGMVVADSVTKKLDILVVADPQTQSGKAKKAQQYGIRIIHEPVFWRLLGVTVE